MLIFQSIKKKIEQHNCSICSSLQTWLWCLFVIMAFLSKPIPKQWLPLFDRKSKYASIYSPSGNSSSRNSFDGDETAEGLLEKDRTARGRDIRYREPWWKKITVLVVGHLILFTLYAMVLFVIVTKKGKIIRAEGLPICTLTPLPQALVSTCTTHSHDLYG
jgi:glucan phosphoethanolaminetransferase (alkaline phosphatase superfamily)